ncbi:Eukaryotic translation initiation factor 3 subunit [Trichinella spiralis]|uniref:Eukaryotic translation initiation factor 3 subunit n=1 Tax=Trichinella spiralis TaxID=6334 RepID=A0ABR3KJ19_TRISP
MKIYGADYIGLLTETVIWKESFKSEWTTGFQLSVKLIPKSDALEAFQGFGNLEMTWFSSIVGRSNNARMCIFIF